jgi:crossover junction endodeoxyribonuclease RuvC
MLSKSLKSKILNLKSNLTILGIDPGLADTGFGVIEKNGNELNVLSFGVIKTKAQQPTEQRLIEIEEGLEKIIKKYQPQIIGVEKLFFCKNVKTALAVGQARGVVVLVAGKNCLKLHEFTPLQVKQALTSYGKADKNQIQQMVKVILKLKNIPKPDDAADALAIAICCANSR